MTVLDDHRGRLAERLGSACSRAEVGRHAAGRPPPAPATAMLTDRSNQYLPGVHRRTRKGLHVRLPDLDRGAACRSPRSPSSSSRSSPSIALLLFFVEIAPRTGRRYTVIRLVVCVLAPAIAFLAARLRLAGPPLVAAVLGGAVLPARLPVEAGRRLPLPAHRLPRARRSSCWRSASSTRRSRPRSTRSTAAAARFIGFDNFVWIFTQPKPPSAR